MNSQTIPAWEDYSSNSEEDEVSHSSFLISEATKQLFLRKYAGSSLSEKELLSIFTACQYNDKAIRSRIDEKMKDLLLSHPKEEQFEQGTYCYKGNKYYGKYHKHNRNDYYVSCHKGGYAKKPPHKNSGRKGYGKEQDKGKGYYTGNKTRHYYEENEREIEASSQTYETEVIELSDLKKELQEIDEDQRTTSKTSTTPSKTQEFIEAIPEISLTYLTNEKDAKVEDAHLSPKTEESSPMDSNKISPKAKGNSAYYPSKLFPGVFFSKPIEQNYNPLLHYQSERQNNIKNPFAQAYNYYMLA